MDRYAYLQFGVGPRVCIGAQFAMTEATLVLSRMPDAQRRLFALFATGITLLFVAGTVFSEALPWVTELPEQLFRLYVDAKRWAQRWRRAIPSLVEAWPNHYLAQEQGIFKTDPWAYGMQANRHVLEKFLAFCEAQGITARRIAAEEILCALKLKPS